MTVSTTTRLAGPFTGTGANADLPFEFKVFAASDLEVTREGTVLTLTTHYTVALNSDQDNDPGGAVTILAAANILGEDVFIGSAVPETQQSDLPSQSAWSPRVVENAIDKLTILIQQIRSVLSRSWLMPIGENGILFPSAADRANMAVGFDSSGDLDLFSSDPSLRADLTALGTTVGGIATDLSDIEDRALLVPIGETIGTLPDLATRLDKFLKFDPVTGDPVAATGTGTGGTLADGTYNDIAVSGGGTAMTIVTSLMSAAARTLNAQTTQALMRSVGLGLGTASLLTTDTDGALAANSDASAPTQKAVKTYVDNAVTGLLDFKGATDCSTNPNYPAASKGDAYVVSVAGKIGGASGTSVDIGDVYLATADNAGGTQASVGASWRVLEHNLVGALLAANNLSDVANAATARANLGILGMVSAASLADPGYISFDIAGDTFTFQWGSGTLSSGGNATLTFSPSYSTFAIAIAGGGSSNNSHQGDTRVTAVSLTTASITTSDNLATTVPYWWAAWGK